MKGGISMGIFKPDVQRLDKERNISGLLKCLEHRNTDVRYSAFVALAHGIELSDEVSERLKQMVHDPDPWVRTLAVLRFAGLGDERVSDSLLEIMDEGTVNNRIELMKVIASRGVSDDAGVLQAIVIGLGDRKEVVRDFAIRAALAVKSRHLMQYLGDLLHEKHHKLRIMAAKSLFEIGGDDSADYLISLLADKNEDVQTAARSYLSEIKVEYVQKALHDAAFKNLVAGMTGREPEREKTAAYIGTEKIREGLPLLHRGCRDKYKGVRVESLRSMAKFKDQASIEFAERLLDDKFHDVRLEALNTLEAIGGIRAWKAVEIALEDKNREVRTFAEIILQRNR